MTLTRGKKWWWWSLSSSAWWVQGKLAGWKPINWVKSWFEKDDERRETIYHLISRVAITWLLSIVEHIIIMIMLMMVNFRSSFRAARKASNVMLILKNGLLWEMRRSKKKMKNEKNNLTIAIDFQCYNQIARWNLNKKFEPFSQQMLNLISIINIIMIMKS